MAVYNTQDFLPAAIDSVIEQTFGQWELICINDGSTDSSLHLLNQYQGKDPRIIVVDRPHRGNNANTRNAGLGIARGHYIAMLDSDDRIEPTYLEKLIVRQQQTQADIVISSLYYWDYKNSKISRNLTGVCGDISRILSGRESFVLSLHWQIGGIGLHRANTLKKMKYCETIMWGDEYTARLCFLQAKKVAFSDAIYFYRENQSSTTRTFSYKILLSTETRSLLLTLIRKNNFDRNIYAPYYVEVVMELISDYVMFLQKRKLLSKMEKRTVLFSLGRVTINMWKEFFLSPLPIKSIFQIMHQLFAMLWRKIGKIMTNLFSTRKEQ